MKRRLSFVFIICVALYLFGQFLFLYLSFGLIYIYLGNFLFNPQRAKILEGSNFTWTGLKFFFRVVKNIFRMIHNPCKFKIYFLLGYKCFFPNSGWSCDHPYQQVESPCPRNTNWNSIMQLEY